MTAEGCRTWREQLGAYALGHLGADERASVQAHLDGCAACRAEAEGLGAVARVLPAAAPDRMQVAPVAPDSLARALFARIDAERRTSRRGRRTRVGLAFAGACAAVAAIAVSAALLLGSDDGGGGDGSQTERVAFDRLPGDVHIGAGLTPRPWGTQIDLYVKGVPSGTMCEVWLRRRNGGRVLAGSFRYVAGSDSYSVRLASALDRSRAAAIGVRAGRWTYVEKLPAA
jgi:hypothetical protein